MNRGLEALKQYRNNHQGVNVYADELLDIIEKSLKALELIETKRINIEYIKCCETYEQYKTICSYAYEITKEEFDFLKEALR
jgi:hypothetical protein